MDGSNTNKRIDEPIADPGNIKLQIRTARVQKFLTVDEGIAIKELRVKVADEFEVDDPALTVLIFGGKILKDSDDLQTHGIKDGQTIHLVIRTKPSNDSSNLPDSARQQSSSNPGAINTNSSNANSSTPGANPLLANLGDVQQRLQQMLISNPESVQNMMNPVMQQMMQNPEMIRNLFGSMQRMQSLMERNPEMNHLLSNPDVLRESLEMVRNPAALQEVMRNYDRAINNMESMPGGHNVLRRMYTEFQEPLLSAFQEQFNNNQFDSNPETDANTEGDNQSNEQQGTENRDPLPNPWASTPSGIPRSAAPNSQVPTMGPRSEPMNSSNTTNLLQQATSMMQNPEMLSLLTNPEAIRSMEQIQQGYISLQRIAPSLFSNQHMPQLPTRLFTGLNSRPGSNSGQATDANTADLQSTPNQEMIERMLRLMSTGANGVTNQSGSTVGGEQGSSADAVRMISQMMGSQSQQPPEERYSQQLQVLSDMGFTNRQTNLQVLIETFGDINAAIARLLPQ